MCAGKCSYETHYHDRRLIKTVPRSLKVAISTLASKHSEARKDKAACDTKCETVQEAKRLIEHSLQEQYNKVREACLRVRTNCRGFNVAEELCMFVNFLKNDMNSLRSTSVIRKAAKFVEKLEALADELQYDESLTPIVDPASANASTSARSPLLATKRKVQQAHKQAPKVSPSQTASVGVRRTEV